MATCADITRDLYAFAYRGESRAVHSGARILLTHGNGEPPIPERLMLHNVIVTALVIFASTSILMRDDRAAKMALRLQEVVHARVGAKSQ